MVKKIAEERVFSKDIIFESSITSFCNLALDVSNVSCLFCPFVKDASKGAN